MEKENHFNAIISEYYMALFSNSYCSTKCKKVLIGRNLAILVRR